MLAHEKVAQAFAMAWCAPCTMGRAKFDFGPKIFLVFFVKFSSFWAEIFSVFGQASVSVMGQNSDKNIQLSFMISVF
jgi:hypothetical protein